MARARNIKPGFFKNEDLAECSPWARLCFAGLWVLADRDGRLEDRPKRIKGELFPFDSVEVEPLLQELVRFKFIVRYETDGMKAIQVSEFQRHQTPHYSEKPSVIKPPEGQEDSKKLTPIKRGSQPPDSPNPDSPNVLPSEDEEANASLSPAVPPTPGLPESPNPCPPPPLDLEGLVQPPTLPSCPHDDLIATYHEVLPELPKVRLATPDRRKALAKTWRWVLTSRRADGERRATTASEAREWFRDYFTRARSNDFLMGRTHRAGEHAGWQCTLDFLLTDRGLKHVIERTPDQPT